MRNGGNRDNQNVCEEQNYQFAFKTYSKEIYSYIYYKIGNEEKAKDLVQESFIKLWENCSKVPLDKVKFFLLRVTKNKIIDAYRTKKITVEYSDAVMKRVEKEHPEFLLEEKQYGQRLNAVLNKMPEKLRVTFLLNRIDGKKYREIATILEVSQKTVEHRMKNALEFLRDELGYFNK